MNRTQSPLPGALRARPGPFAGTRRLATASAALALAACSADAGHRPAPRAAERASLEQTGDSPEPAYARASYPDAPRGVEAGRDDQASAQPWRHRNEPAPPPPAQQPVAPPPPASGTAAPPPRTDPPPARSPSLTQRFLRATGLNNLLPNGGEGMTLIQIANVRLELTPSLHDPLTALGACVDRISYCYTPGSQSLDQCVAQAPSCRTPEPWHESDCCPTECRTAYDTARRAGRDPMTAFQDVYFRNPDCFPGVRAMITRSP